MSDAAGRNDRAFNDQERLPANAHQKERDEKLTAFLHHLMETGNPSVASRLAGYTTSTYPRIIRKKDPNFAELWDEAMTIFAEEVLEPEAVRRAVRGVYKPVFNKGVVVGHTVEYSDSLLIKLLQARMRDKYGNTMDLNAQVQHNIVMMPSTAQDNQDWERQAAELKEQQNESMQVIEAEFKEVPGSGEKTGKPVKVIQRS